MNRGGGFEAIQDFLLNSVATVRRAETTMVIGTAMVNAMITINTAAEIAIAPYIARSAAVQYQRLPPCEYPRREHLRTRVYLPVGRWRSHRIRDATVLPGQYEWFTQAMVVNPVQVWPYVFHGWFLVRRVHRCRADWLRPRVRH